MSDSEWRKKIQNRKARGGGAKGAENAVSRWLLATSLLSENLNMLDKLCQLPLSIVNWSGGRACLIRSGGKKSKTAKRAEEAAKGVENAVSRWPLATSLLSENLNMLDKLCQLPLSIVNWYGGTCMSDSEWRKKIQNRKARGGGAKGAENAVSRWLLATSLLSENLNMLDKLCQLPLSIVNWSGGRACLIRSGGKKCKTAKRAEEAQRAQRMLLAVGCWLLATSLFSENLNMLDKLCQLPLSIVNWYGDAHV